MSKTIIRPIMEKIISFKGDERLEQSIERECRISGRDRNELISKLLKGSLLVRAAERAREKYVPIGEAHGYLTDEDVFRNLK